MPRSSVYRSVSNAQEADVAAQRGYSSAAPPQGAAAQPPADPCRTETCHGSESVVNLVLEDLDEPLNPEDEGGSFSDFLRSHVK